MTSQQINKGERVVLVAFNEELNQIVQCDDTEVEDSVHIQAKPLSPRIA